MSPSHIRFALPALLLVLVLALSDPLAGADFQVVTIDSLRFEASIASQAIPPTPYFKVPFGKGADQVGGSEQDPNHVTEGVPYAFRPQVDGSVWVLDWVNQALKLFGPDGKLQTQRSLAGLFPRGDGVVRDFAPAPNDGFYLLSARDGKVLRTDAAGKVVVEIEGLTDARAIGTDAKGNLLVDMPTMNALLRFNPAGEIVDQYPLPRADLVNAGLCTDPEGRPYFLRGSEQAVELCRFTQASPTREVVLATFVNDVPAERKARFVSAKVLGIDAPGNVYVELVACDNDGVIHRHRVSRVSPDGKVLASADIRVVPYLSPDLPRHVTVMPDGRLLGFHVYSPHWHLVTWALGK